MSLEIVLGVTQNLEIAIGPKQTKKAALLNMNFNFHVMIF